MVNRRLAGAAARARRQQAARGPRRTPYERLFGAVLVRLDAERAHRLGFGALRAVAAVPGAARAVHRLLVPRDPGLEVDAFGRLLTGPLALAAGFDKDAKGIDALGMLGFAAVEIGTVTARSQRGNPRPRLFRLVADRAVVNRMGFNNDGAVAVAARLRRRAARPHLPVGLGVNIGRTRVVPAEDTVADYVTSARLLAPYADYLVVNVSSPNTPGLRDLQAVASLRPLLRAVAEAADAAAGRAVPLLVKIAPDLADGDVRAVADLAVELGLAGVVATNTTVSRSGLASSAEEVVALGAGGLSGAPLTGRSLEVLRLLRERAGDGLVLVSAGGVSTAEDVRERLAAGATLVQAYTAFVYGGALWPRRVLRGLARHHSSGRGTPRVRSAVRRVATSRAGGAG